MYMFVNKANISSYISGESVEHIVCFWQYGTAPEVFNYCNLALNAKYVHLLSPASAVGVPYKFAQHGW